jgi:hypothetical protein
MTRLLLTLTVGMAAGWLLASWTLMIVAGVAHHEWWQAVPTMSYSAAMAITVMPVGMAYVGATIRGLVSS